MKLNSHSYLQEKHAVFTACFVSAICLYQCRVKPLKTQNTVI